jgi:hypothetical protein
MIVSLGIPSLIFLHSTDVRGRNLDKVKVSHTLCGVGKDIPKEREVKRRQEVCELEG